MEGASFEFEMLSRRRLIHPTYFRSIGKETRYRVSVPTLGRNKLLNPREQRVVCNIAPVDADLRERGIFLRIGLQLNKDSVIVADGGELGNQLRWPRVWANRDVLGRNLRDKHGHAKI